MPAAMRLYTCTHLVERSWLEGQDALDRGNGDLPLWCTGHESPVCASYNLPIINILSLEDLAELPLCTFDGQRETYSRA